MQLTLLHGYPDYIGKRQAICGYGSGPKSYTQAASGGDVVSLPLYQQYADILFPALSVSGTYIVYPFPKATGARQTWALKWVTASTGAEVAGSTDLSAESVQIAGFAGMY